ncbi:hypothetical protein DTW91_10330 [Chryseobacterium sp. SC28]|nr:hypothetical protein DTW91_10330 [Chryseobacterium sp. SC28]
MMPNMREIPIRTVNNRVDTASKKRKTRLTNNFAFISYHGQPSGPILSWMTGFRENNGPSIINKNFLD